MDIDHDSESHRFSLEESGHVSVLDYELDGRQMTITHTYVPGELRGRGIAAELVQEALEHAREQGWTVVPQCSYVAAYMARHKEYSDLL
ncbi:GNAT family N-acetyltransferase [Verrucomicrobium sp. BvORR106]|uniref:GNAT family N-acetyltransferase n=1 Tax=Verrucomicrobium sp. BvORR106 TaxID=1403819 RepID=UPI0005706644|nr:GNAT family N-acetyltransferase [Verrucomicrobium sp. BvORR106]